MFGRSALAAVCAYGVDPLSATLSAWDATAAASRAADGWGDVLPGAPVALGACDRCGADLPAATVAHAMTAVAAYDNWRRRHGCAPPAHTLTHTHTHTHTPLPLPAAPCVRCVVRVQ